MTNTQPIKTHLSNDEVISTLNNLITTCRDGQNGFQTAMEGVENSHLKTSFAEFSQQRAHFVGELQEQVRSLGGDPENMGSVAASLHRGWMDIKAVITSKDEAAILAECERGEASAVKQYQEALQANLPAPVQEIVAKHLSAVYEAHNRIKSSYAARAASA